MNSDFYLRVYNNSQQTTNRPPKHIVLETESKKRAGGKWRCVDVCYEVTEVVWSGGVAGDFVEVVDNDDRSTNEY